MKTRSMPSNPTSLWSISSMWPASMRPPAGGLPGAGFLIVVISYLAAAGFLYFGAQTPRLQTAFDILSKHARDAKAGFAEPELEVLREVLDEHSGFSLALIGRGPANLLERGPDGWLRKTNAHLVVSPTAGSPTALLLESYGNPRDYPITVVVSGSGAAKTLKLTSTEPVALEWGPNELVKPSIFEFRVNPASRGRSSDTWGLRVSAAQRETP